jgi:hypothetical protein
MSPYFYIHNQNGSWFAQGEHHCFLGHKIEDSGSDKPDGIFAQWDWDGTSLEVTNDRYGMFPLYYVSTPTTFGVSTSISELLERGAPAQLDTNALGVFLRLGFFINDHTPFKYIRAMGPLKRCIWKDGHLVREEKRPALEYRDISRSEAIDEYIQRFRGAIQKRSIKKGPALLPLTGGRDSRHMLFELLRAGTKPDKCLLTNGHPSSGDDDVTIAKMLAKRFDLSHDIIPEPRSRIDAEQRKNRLTNFSALEHTWYIVIGDYIRSHHYNTVYPGIGGGILSDGTFMTYEKNELYRQKNWRALSDILLPKDSEVILNELIHPSLMQQMKRKRALDILVDELKHHAQNPNPVSSFYFWNKLRRSFGPCQFGICKGAEYIFAPYLDADVYDFLISLSSDMFLDTMFHSETIARAFPEYKDIPYARKPGGKKVGLIYDLNYLKDLLLFVRRYRSELLKDSIVKRIGSIIINKKYKKSQTGFAPLIVYLTQISRLMCDHK